MLHEIVNGSRSLHRTLVDEALTQRGTDLSTFVKAGRAQGKSVEEIWIDLRQLTGVAFTSRTLYRWVNEIEQAA